MIELKNNIYILIDCDVDGYTSSSVLKMFLTEYYPNINVVPIFHKGNPKAHGFCDSIMNQLLELPKGLIISADGGLNDTKECKILKDNGFDVLILEHHHKEQDNPYAIIINCQDGNVDNKLSGCGVVWQFCNYIKPKSVNKYISYVMLSILSDSMDLTSPQNMTFVKRGKKRIYKNLQPFVDKFVKNPLNNKDYSFSLINRFNACIRYGTQKDKEELFYCLCGERQITDKFLDRLVEIHKTQNKDRDMLVDKILEHNQNTNKNYLLVKLKKSNPLSGLVANRLLDKLSMNIVMILSETKDSFTGSVRSILDSKQILSDSKLVEWAKGHASSHGVCYLKENDTALQVYLDSVLGLYQAHTSVLLSSRINTIPKSIFSLVEPYTDLYGQGITKPLIHIKPFKVNGLEWKELGKGQTIKFIRDGIEFIHFFTSNDKKQELNVGENTDYELELIGEISLNEWRENIKPQIIIDKFEIKEWR